MNFNPKKIENSKTKGSTKWYDGDGPIVIGSGPSVLKFLQEQEAFHQERIAWHKQQLEQVDFLIRVHNEQYNEDDDDTTLVVSDIKQPMQSPKGDSKELTNDRASWKETAMAVIEKYDKLLRSNDIIEYSGILLSVTELRNAKVYLSIVLKELCEEGVLKRHVIRGVKGYYYGLPYMFEGDVPKEKFFDGNVRQ